MAGNHDKRAFFDVNLHLSRLRCAEGFGVGLVEQLHALEVDLPEFNDERKPFLNGMRAVDGTQALVKPCAHCVVCVAEIHRVVRIRRHALHAEQQRGTQRNRICIALPQFDDLTRFSAEFLTFRAYPLGEFCDGLIVEVDVRQGGEQTVHQQPVGGLCALTGRRCRLGQSNEFVHQFVL